jgi:hypothetical protein
MGPRTKQAGALLGSWHETERKEAAENTLRAAETVPASRSEAAALIIGVAHPWEFGWESLVAIGTLSLAAVTGYLSWKTRTLAQATTNEVAAQSRPLLVPGRRGPAPSTFPDQPIHYDIDEGQFVITIRNDGSGPAFFVRAEMDPGGDTAGLWNLGSLGPGAEASLNFSANDFPPHKQVLLDYRDFAGRPFSSALVLQRIGSEQEGNYRFYDVRTFQDESLTGHGDALPQAGFGRCPPTDWPAGAGRLRCG